jgi:hypothetical protein
VREESSTHSIFLLTALSQLMKECNEGTLNLPRDLAVHFSTASLFPHGVWIGHNIGDVVGAFLCRRTGRCLTRGTHSDEGVKAKVKR